MVKNIIKKLPFAKAASKAYSAHNMRKSYEAEFQRIKNCFAEAKNPLFLEMLPRSGNLGDHAICIAEIRLIKSFLPEYQIIEVYNGFNYQDRKYNKLSAITNGYPILITGGGNVGTLWLEDAECNIRHIIKENPKSPIALLPNTFYFDKNPFGDAELEKSTQIYNAHDQLKLYVREKISFDLYSGTFHNLTLMPDMVMSLEKEEPRENRSGCVLCLRNDTEKTLIAEQKKALMELLESKFSSITLSDTVIPESLNNKTRESAVEAKLSQFRKAKLVVTDRLHAMVFCAITATPCVVIKSKSHKIQGCYEWIKNNPYIYMTDSFDDVFKLDFSFTDAVYHYDGNKLKTYYENMMQEIGDMLKKGGTV